MPPRNWDKLIPYVLELFAYWEMPQASTGFSLFELLYGGEVRRPLNIVWGMAEKSNESMVLHEAGGLLVMAQSRQKG